MLEGFTSTVQSADRSHMRSLKAGLRRAASKNLSVKGADLVRAESDGIRQGVLTSYKFLIILPKKTEVPVDVSPDSLRTLIVVWLVEAMTGIGPERWVEGWKHLAVIKQHWAGTLVEAQTEFEADRYSNP